MKLASKAGSGTIGPVLTPKWTKKLNGWFCLLACFFALSKSVAAWTLFPINGNLSVGGVGDGTNWKGGSIGSIGGTNFPITEMRLTGKITHYHWVIGNPANPPTAQADGPPDEEELPPNTNINQWKDSHNTTPPQVRRITYRFTSNNDPEDFLGRKIEVIEVVDSSAGGSTDGAEESTNDQATYQGWVANPPAARYEASGSWTTASVSMEIVSSNVWGYTDAKHSWERPKLTGGPTSIPTAAVTTQTTDSPSAQTSHIAAPDGPEVQYENKRLLASGGLIATASSHYETRSIPHQEEDEDPLDANPPTTTDIPGHFGHNTGGKVKFSWRSDWVEPDGSELTEGEKAAWAAGFLVVLTETEGEDTKVISFQSLADLIGEGTWVEVQTPDPTSNPGVARRRELKVVAIQAVEPQPDGSLAVVSGPTLRGPSPTVEVESLDVSGLAMQTDSEGLHSIAGTVQVAGAVDDALCEITQGSRGQIKELYLLVNDKDSYPITINHDKSESEDVLKRYDYTGNFSQSINNVKLCEGVNTLKLVAINMIDMKGYSLHSCEITGSEASGGALSGSISVAFAAVPDAMIVDEIEVTGTNPAFQATFIETAPDSNVFAWTQSGESIWKLMLNGNSAAWSDQTADAVDILLVNQAAGGLAARPVVLTESGAATLAFENSGAEPDLGGLVSYAVESVNFIEKSAPGPFHPVMYRLDLPAEMAAGLTAKFDDAKEAATGYEALDKDRAFVTSEDYDGLFLGGSDDETPGLFVLAQTGKGSEGNSTLDLEIEDDSSFAEGFGVGFVGGGVDLIEDGVSLVSWVGKTATRVWDLWLTNSSVTTQLQLDAVSLFGKAAGAYEVGERIYSFLSAHSGDAAEAVIALIVGDETTLNQLAGEHVEALCIAAEVFDFAAEQYGNMTNDQKGRLYGRITYEVLGVMTGSAEIKALTKIQFLEKLTQRPFFQAGEGAGLVTKIVAFIQELATTKMCFVAGTPVLTADGLRPIESIRSGDLVWSKNEKTRTEMLRPVMDTFVTHPSTLYTVRLDGDGDQVADETLTCTGEHPFWIGERGTFVPVGEARVGWHVLRARGGGEMVIVGLEREEAAPGKTFTTYNFEVAENHTYFVGEAGVWVHNTGGTPCERVFSLFTRLMTKHADDMIKAFDDVLAKLPNMTAETRLSFIEDLIEKRRFLGDLKLPKPPANGFGVNERVLIGASEGLKTSKLRKFIGVRQGTHGDPATKYLWTIDKRGINAAWEKTPYPTPRGNIVHSNLSDEAFIGGEVWFDGNRVTINAGSGRFGDGVPETQAHWEAAIRYWKHLGYEVNAIPWGER